MELGERSDPAVAVLYHLRKEKGISAEVYLNKEGGGRGGGQEKY